MTSPLIAGLRYRALRLRHDWWYRWAHDPLCDRLGGGVLTIGKLRLCRSCVAMYSGVAAGGAVAVANPAMGAAALAPHIWLGGASGAGIASLPQVYRRLDRRAKDGLRFGTGVLGGGLLAFALARQWQRFTTLAALAAVGYRVLTLARAKAKASACDGCPELDAKGICSGYAQQAVSLRAYENAASELAMKERLRAMA